MPVRLGDLRAIGVRMLSSLQFYSVGVMYTADYYATPVRDWEHTLYAQFTL